MSTLSMAFSYLCQSAFKTPSSPLSLEPYNTGLGEPYQTMTLKYYKQQLLLDFIKM